MEFNDCTIIIPVIRETDLFEQVVNTILGTCEHADIREFIVVVCEKTAKESFNSIENMRIKCEQLDIDYALLWQKLPGFGGAIREGIDISKGTHTIFVTADMAYDPNLVSLLMDNAKKYPCDITSVSRHKHKGSISKDYSKVKLIWNVCAQLFLSVLYTSKITDFTYSFRIAPTSLYQNIRWETFNHSSGMEGALKAIRLGVKFHEIPGNHFGGSQSGMSVVKEYLPVALKTRFMRKKNILKKDV